ncbi:hypothetical protein AYI68_g6398 [Smittium mucronatum]|uniref:Uncharacterized protein n=1 Tax=Smittium mucronatum TaxID=133383 RepID=A0A1R0GRM8_9FUNG|nr:hypothetical protein AYI68_g6398 [Smittium mucronatum]
MNSIYLQITTPREVSRIFVGEAAGEGPSRARIRLPNREATRYDRFGVDQAHPQPICLEHRDGGIQNLVQESSSHEIDLEEQENFKLIIEPYVSKIFWEGPHLKSHLQRSKRNITKEVSALLEKCEIEEVPTQISGFYSQNFIIPKKTGDLLTVLDPRYPNKNMEL